MAGKLFNKKGNIESAETRKNVVPVGLASYDTIKLKPKKYDYDPHLAFMISESIANVIIIQEVKYEGNH